MHFARNQAQGNANCTGPPSGRLVLRDALTQNTLARILYCIFQPVVFRFHVPIQKKEQHMLYYALVFLIVALIAGALGFGGVAGTATGIAKILFVVFIVLFIASLVFGGIRRR
jgi:uncharacterized membrane protein YtjA (UPF0391 family)